MSHREPLPFGPELKDPLWRWGAWAVGVVTVVALLWLATLGDVNLLLHVYTLVLLVFGVLMSMRTGRAWQRGERPERHFGKVVHPTVDVQGQPGSTYVLVEPARTGRRVRPDQLSPFWWALYSVVVRAPVALGDVTLTLGWRWLGGLGAGGAALTRGLQMDHLDHPDRVRSPDDDAF